MATKGRAPWGTKLCPWYVHVSAELGRAAHFTSPTRVGRRQGQTGSQHGRVGAPPRPRVNTAAPPFTLSVPSN